MNRFFGFLICFFLMINVAFGLPYDFSDVSSVDIPLTLLKPLATNQEIFEGQEIELKVKKNIYCHNCLLIKKGTIAKARIETIITKGMNGFPAEIIIDNFEIDGIKKEQLMSTYTKTGRSYALLVYPIKWALTPIPFVGSLTNLIHGGEVKLDTDDIIKIKYFPHWN
ncbi:MAG: hypothetical protein IJB79_02990 [Candidatus Gastranaerophilales bacterium]|nr:hypothetical protein [Candidatus Gastranaerophilales bacterium]